MCVLFSCSSFLLMLLLLFLFIFFSLLRTWIEWRYHLFLHFYFFSHKIVHSEIHTRMHSNVKIAIMKQICGKQVRQRSASSKLRVDDLQTQMNGTNLFPSTGPWIDSLMKHNKSGWVQTSSLVMVTFIFPVSVMLAVFPHLCVSIDKIVNDNGDKRQQQT